MKQSLDGSLPKMCLAVRPFDQDGSHSELSLTQDPMGNSHKNDLVWNQQLNQNQTLMEQSLDGPLSKLCLAVTLSHQDGCHSAVALLLKAALIQVSDCRFMGASGFTYFPKSQIQKKNIIYSNKFFHNFHLSQSSFTCSRLRASGLARRLLFIRNKLQVFTNTIYC